MTPTIKSNAPDATPTIMPGLRGGCFGSGSTSGCDGTGNGSTDGCDGSENGSTGGCDSVGNGSTDGCDGSGVTNGLVDTVKVVLMDFDSTVVVKLPTVNNVESVAFVFSKILNVFVDTVAVKGMLKQGHFI